MKMTLLKYWLSLKTRRAFLVLNLPEKKSESAFRVGNIRRYSKLEKTIRSLQVQEKGSSNWYATYYVRIAPVKREYSMLA